MNTTTIEGSSSHSQKAVNNPELEKLRNKLGEGMGEDNQKKNALWRWIGLKDKSLWDFIQILIVPLLLLFVAEYLNDAADQRQQRDSQNRQQHEVYTQFLTFISGLILDGGLTESKVNQSVKAVAKARTLDTLQEIGPDRRRSLITFLAQSRLINGMNPAIHLSDADLHEVDLSGLYLWEKNLVGTNLEGANLSHSTLSKAFLMGVNFRNADLRGANFWYARLTHAQLENADLRHANLINANLEDTRLSGALLEGALYSEQTQFPVGFDPSQRGTYAIAPNSDLQGAQLQNAFLRYVKLTNANLAGANLESAQLQGADLRSANLSDANLSGAYLSEANLTGANLENANLCGTTMPDKSISNKGCP